MIWISSTFDEDFYLFSGSCITNRNFYNFCYKLICSIFSSLVHETSQMRINYTPFAIYCHPKTCLRFLQLSAEERETVSLLHKKFCIRFSFTYWIYFPGTNIESPRWIVNAQFSINRHFDAVTTCESWTPRCRPNLWKRRFDTDRKALKQPVGKLVVQSIGEPFPLCRS